VHQFRIIKLLMNSIMNVYQLNDNQSSRFLAWFPPRFPGNLRCVVSTRDNHYPCIARLESRQAHFFHLDKLSTDAAANVVKHYLSRFNKVCFCVSVFYLCYSIQFSFIFQTIVLILFATYTMQVGIFNRCE